MWVPSGVVTVFIAISPARSDATEVSAVAAALATAFCGAILGDVRSGFLTGPPDTWRCERCRRGVRGASGQWGGKTATQLQSYGTRLRGDEPRLPRDDPRGCHDVALVGRGIEKILYEERRRPVTEVQATAEIH